MRKKNIIHLLKKTTKDVGVSVFMLNFAAECFVQQITNNMTHKKREMEFKATMWMLIPLVVCLFGGCSDDNNESGSSQTPVSFSISITSPELESEVITYSSETVDTRFRSYYNDGAYFQVLARQNGSMVDLGSFPLIKTSSDGKEGRIEVKAKDKLISEKPYDLYIIGGSWRWDESDLYYKESLTRSGGFPTWIKLHSSSQASKATHNLCGTVETLWL